MGNLMSTERKIVKVLSIVVLLLAVMAFVPGMKVFVTGAAGTSGFKLFEGAFDIVFGVANFALGVLGIKGANTPSRMGPFATLSLVCAIAVAACLTVALTYFGSTAISFLPVIVPYLACLVAGFILGRKVLAKTQK